MVIFHSFVSLPEGIPKKLVHDPILLINILGLQVVKRENTQINQIQRSYKVAGLGRG